jgi:hypothetical protein
MEESTNIFAADFPQRIIFFIRIPCAYLLLFPTSTSGEMKGKEKRGRQASVQDFDCLFDATGKQNSNYVKIIYVMLKGGLLIH